MSGLIAVVYVCRGAEVGKNEPPNPVPGGGSNPAKELGNKIPLS